MDFKKSKQQLVLFSFSWILFLVGCSEIKTSKEEYIIGTSLDSVSSLSDSSSQDTVSLYDKSAQRIHSFDLVNMKITGSTKVSNPKDDHYIIANNEDSFVVDLSKSQLAIYSKLNPPVKNPIRFNGTPISSAYNKTNRLLVVYDDLYSVGVLKLSATGQVLKSWVGGPILGYDSTILAGDITENGSLVLSMSDNSLAIVNLENSLDQQQWVFTVQNLIHEDVKWLAPVGGDLIMYNSRTDVVLYDISNQTIVSSISNVALSVYPLYSKSVDPHIVFRNSNSSYLLVFTDGLTIRTRSFTNIGTQDVFLQSTLDQVKNQWSFVKSIKDSYVVFGGTLFINSVFVNRVAETFRFQDMLNLSTRDLPDEAELKQAGDFIFALFPSELGYAKKIDLITEDQSELKLFNIPYIK